MAEMEGSTPRPPTSANSITRPRQRFAIRTDEFEPRFRIGEVAEVEAGSPKAGDEIYAETLDGRQVIGRFIDLKGRALALVHPCDGTEFGVSIRPGRCWPVVARWHDAPHDVMQRHA